MVSAANTKASLDALYKTVYGDTLEKLVPDFAIIQQRIKFDTAKKNGRKFETSLSLTHEHGFSYGNGLVTLEEAVNAENQPVEVTGSPFYLRSVFTYDQAAAMVSGGKGAFISNTEYRLYKMKTSAAYRLELQLLYGESGNGRTNSDEDAVTSVVNTSQVVIPLRESSWSAAIWSGAENAPISLFLSSDGSPIAGVTPNKFKVISVDTDEKTLTIQAANATDAGNIVAAVEAADHDIFWYGAKGNEMTGIKSIISNKSTLFGLDGTRYSLWQGNTYNADGPLTFKKVLQAIDKAVAKGLMDDVVVLTPSAAYTSMADNEAAFRQYTNQKGGKVEVGPEGITFRASNGKAEIMPHPLLKSGHAMVLPLNEFKRIGASDLTFKTPGKEEEMFLHLPTQTGYECRLYSDQAIFSTCIAKCVEITGITYN